MKKNQSSKIISNIEITDISEDGKGIGRFDNKVIFVDNAIPKDILDILVYKKKSKFWLAKIQTYLKHSPYHAKPFCSHFGTCGGCKWQHLDYERQLYYKQLDVTQTLKRLSGLSLPEPLPILPAPEQIYYRNKLEFTFTKKRWLSAQEIKSEQNLQREGLGLHLPKRFDKVLDLDTCYLQSPISNTIRLAIRDFSIQNKLPFFDLIEQNGLLRTLTIRINIHNKLMLIVQFYEDSPLKNKLLDYIKQTFKEDVVSLYYVINTKKNDTYADLPLILYYGSSYLEEYIEDLKFHIGPKSFFQTNSRQTQRLYQCVREFANIKPQDYILDLYTGIGTIALSVAKFCRQVIGIEYLPNAIEDAKKNAILNTIHNVSFYAGDVKDVLKLEEFDKYGKPDIIITDPPRVGMDKSVSEQILILNPQKIVYVSCNPSTQARDLLLLSKNYKVMMTQAIDMFPHTKHIENVLLLERK